MSGPRDIFRLRASFGPRDLFLVLKQETEKPQFRKVGAGFDFDWIKRRIVLSAETEPEVEALMEAVSAVVERRAGPGMLLPGKAVSSDKGVEIPIGVLLQTPDVYIEMIASLLGEMGVSGIQLEFEGDGISIPSGGATARLIDHRSLIRGFPLPGYIHVEECESS